MSDKALVLFKDNVDLLYPDHGGGFMSASTTPYPDLNEHILVDISIKPFNLSFTESALDSPSNSTVFEPGLEFEQMLAMIRDRNSINIFTKTNVEEITQSRDIVFLNQLFKYYKVNF
jgi:hypothetical protein